MKHILKKDIELAICVVCKGGEGELSTDCCEHKLNQYILEAIYKGGLDYKNGKWEVKQND